MALTQEQLAKMFGLGQIGAGIGGIFGKGGDPSKEAMKYIDQIPGQTNQYFDPYFQAGKSQLPGLQEQYSQLLGGPGEKLNQIGSSYQQSPGFKFAMEQALKGAGNAAAAGGMAGSPQHEQQNMTLASDLASQDYNNWLQQATGLYGQGLSGSQGLAGAGQQAGQSQADMISNALAQKGNLAYQSQKYKNENSPWGGILGGLGSLAAFL